MKVLLLGKAGGITRWPEDIASDLKIGGHSVAIVPTRNPRLSRSIEDLLLSPAIGAPLARSIVRRIRRFAPDVLLAVGALDQLPKVIFEHIAAMRGRPPLMAWIGDAFTTRAADIADLFDIIAYTDTGMVTLHHQCGFRAKSAFVPIGATRIHQIARIDGPRSSLFSFVGAPTPLRRQVLAQLAEPVNIFGPGWDSAPELAHHTRDVRRVGDRELAEIYASHLATLNIRHGAGVIHGMNQRHFAPYIQRCPVVSDAQQDITLCFEPGTEMLVNRNAAELRDICAQMRRDPAMAAAIGTAGRRRVLDQHTYSHRLLTIAGLAA